MQDDCFIMKNPNLYITLTESDHNGYLLQEDGRLILLETIIESILLT